MTTTTETLEYPIWHDAPEIQDTKKSFIKAEEKLDVTSAKDFELTQAAANGNMMAFEEIYNRHHRRVYSICLRMLQNATEAEDLTQDVFIQLHRKIGSFRGD